MIKVAFMVSALLCSADNWFVLYLVACFIFAVGYVGFIYLFIHSTVFKFDTYLKLGFERCCGIKFTSVVVL